MLFVLHNNGGPDSLGLGLEERGLGGVSVVVTIFGPFRVRHDWVEQRACRLAQGYTSIL